MKNITTIFFDIDNTLVNFSEAQSKAIEEIRKNYFPEMQKKKFEAVWREIQIQIWHRYLRQELTIAEQRTQRMIAIWHAFGRTLTEDDAHKIVQQYLSVFQDSWKLFPDVVSTLQALQKQGLQLGVLTNGNYTQQLKKLQHNGIFHYMNPELLIVSEAVGFAKPDPEIFLFAQKKARALPADILFIGDDFTLDIEPAKKLGWNALHINYFGSLSKKGSLRSLQEVRDLF